MSHRAADAAEQGRTLAASIEIFGGSSGHRRAALCRYINQVAHALNARGDRWHAKSVANVLQLAQRAAERLSEFEHPPLMAWAWKPATAPRPRGGFPIWEQRQRGASRVPGSWTQFDGDGRTHSSRSGWERRDQSSTSPHPTPAPLPAVALSSLPARASVVTASRSGLAATGQRIVGTRAAGKRLPRLRLA
jgi:hypothetical protein